MLVLLEGDVPELKQLLVSNAQSDSSDSVMVVVIRAQAKKELCQQKMRELETAARSSMIEYVLPHSLELSA